MRTRKNVAEAIVVVVNISHIVTLRFANVTSSKNPLMLPCKKKKKVFKFLISIFLRFSSFPFSSRFKRFFLLPSIERNTHNVVCSIFTISILQINHWLSPRIENKIYFPTLFSLFFSNLAILLRFIFLLPIFGNFQL